MDIVIKDGNTELASGELVVTIGNPDTATFTPDGGTLITCNGVVWTTNANGAVGFGFTISGAANGDFPIGTYRFSGIQNANGLPGGTVNWPNRENTADPEPTWQAEATPEEVPYTRSKGAT